MLQRAVGGLRHGIVGLVCFVFIAGKLRSELWEMGLANVFHSMTLKVRGALQIF